MGRPVVLVSGSFDDLRSRHVRFLEEAARLGDVRVLLRSDAALRALTGTDPKLPQKERRYLLDACRFVAATTLLDDPAEPAALSLPGDVMVVDEHDDSPACRAACERRGLAYRVVTDADLAGFPYAPPQAVEHGSGNKVIVTGCFDWFHSGHVRFFEEVSELGNLYVVVGHDANVRLLKGDGHPMLSQDERRYMVGAVRCVSEALISSGHGWMDAEPEIRRIQPDRYAVNEDGDKPEKRRFCEEHGIEYVVLRRQPKPGLPRRESTKLRGF